MADVLAVKRHFVTIPRGWFGARQVPCLHPIPRTPHQLTCRGMFPAGTMENPSHGLP